MAGVKERQKKKEGSEAVICLWRYERGEGRKNEDNDKSEGTKIWKRSRGRLGIDRYRDRDRCRQTDEERKEDFKEEGRGGKK